MRRIATGCLVAGVLAISVTSGRSSEAATTTPQSYPIGVKAKTGMIAAVVYAKSEPFMPLRPSIAPRAGSHFVAVDVQVFNLATQPQGFSAAAGFKLVDSTNWSYGMAPIPGIGFDRDERYRVIPVS